MFWVDLGMGIMRAIFHESGRIPVDRDKLKSLVSEGVTEEETSFSILADMPSGPEDFEASRLEIKSKTSPSLHKR